MYILSAIGKDLATDINADVVNYLIRILIACICGFAIGYERRSRSKEAGIRTHSIVCMAACVMMIVSKYGFSDTEDVDAARIAAQVVTGIGFLGAGIIFYKKDFLHGLTTAAGVWATCGIGLAIGGGMIIIGVFSTMLLILLQIILHKPLKLIQEKMTHIIKIKAVINSEEDIKIINSLFDAKKMIEFKTIKDGDIINAQIELATETSFTPERIYEISKDNPFIISVEKQEEI